MSANETYELAVQLRGEGFDETTSNLEETESSFDDTADSVEGSADEMEGFAAQWDGAMTAILTGLAVASAGLLSQVPVVGEVMSGLVAIIESVAFQMDQVLRPILAPVSDLFFDIADAIFEADGAVGTIIGIIGTLAAIFALVIVPIASLIAFFTSFSGAGAVLVAAGKAIIGVLGTIATALGLPVIAVVALIAIIVALIAIFATDFMGIRTAVVNALTGAWEAIKGFGSDVKNFFTNFVSDAIQWGRDLMVNLAEGIADKASAPIDAAMDAMSGVADAISFDRRENDQMAQRWGRDMLSHFSVGMEQGIKHELPTDGIAPSGDSGPRRPSSGGKDVQVHLDGRRVDKGTRRHRGNETGPRGRHS